MQVWSDWCRCGVIDAHVEWLMQVWCDWCRCGVIDAGMEWLMQVWCDWWRCGVIDAGVEWLMHVWSDWCRYGVIGAGVESGRAQPALLIPRWTRQGFIVTVPVGRQQRRVTALPESTWAPVLMRRRRITQGPTAGALAPLGGSAVWETLHAFHAAELQNILRQFYDYLTMIQRYDRTIDLRWTSSLQNILRRMQYFFAIHLQNRMIVWDSVRKPTCDIPRKELSTL